MMATLGLLLVAGCVGTGELVASVSGQIVGLDNAPIGPGLLMIEIGAVHEGTYQYGALIDEDGRFTRDIPESGLHGLHLFRDDYQYLPVEIDIQDHQQIVLTSTMVSWGVWMDLSGQPTWPAQPSDDTLIRMPWDDIIEDNPVFEDIRMTYQGGGLMEVSVTVSDPDQDLSRMVLAYDETTGQGYALNSPSAPDEQGDYPDGTYTVMVYLDDAHVPGESMWYFVVSDNMCNDTQIVSMPMPEL